jgi:cytochrome c
LFGNEIARYYHRVSVQTYSPQRTTVVRMTTLRAMDAFGPGLLVAVFFVTRAGAQMPLPAAKPPDGATLFKQQCGTCHTSNETDPVRQGPSLFNVVGRRAGTVEGFKYSEGFAKADFAWDEARIDAWLINPQEMIPGSVMAYRQARPEVRAAVIAHLKELK